MVLAVGALSFAAGVTWTGVKFATGSGYWDWPLSWWLLALIWTAGAGLAVLMWRPRVALLTAAASLAGLLLGGLATLFAFLAIYGTGD